MPAKDTERPPSGSTEIAERSAESGVTSGTID